MIDTIVVGVLAGSTAWLAMTLAPLVRRYLLPARPAAEPEPEVPSTPSGILAAVIEVGLLENGSEWTFDGYTVTHANGVAVWVSNGAPCVGLWKRLPKPDGARHWGTEKLFTPAEQERIWKAFQTWKARVDNYVRDQTIGEALESLLPAEKATFTVEAPSSPTIAPDC